MSNYPFVPIGGEFTYAGRLFTAIESASCHFCVFSCGIRCLRPHLEDVDLQCRHGRPDGKSVCYVSSDLVAAIRRSLP